MTRTPPLLYVSAMSETDIPTIVKLLRAELKLAGPCGVVERFADNAKLAEPKPGAFNAQVRSFQSTLETAMVLNLAEPMLAYAVSLMVEMSRKAKTRLALAA